MRRFVVLAVLVAGLAIGHPAGASTTGDVSARPTPVLGDLVLGSDGALWGTAPRPNARAIVRFVPGQPGSLTSTRTPSSAGLPYAIVASPTGDLWVTTSSRHLLRVDAATRAITQVQGVVVGDELAFGPDGRLWSLGHNATHVRAIDVGDDDVTSGEITTVGLSRRAYRSGLTAGQDGNLWMVDHTNHRLVRVDPSTAIVTTFRLPGDVAEESTLFVDEDGVVWIPRAGSVAAIDPATRSFRSFPTPVLATAYRSALSLEVGNPVIGPDGQLWLVGNGALARLDRADGDWDVYPIRPLRSGGQRKLVTDRRGELWVGYNNTLLRVEDRPSSDRTDPTVTVVRPARGEHVLDTAELRARLRCRAPGPGTVVDCQGKWSPYLSAATMVDDGDRVPFRRLGPYRYGRQQFVGLARDQAGNTAFSPFVTYAIDRVCFGEAVTIAGSFEVQGTEGDDVIFLGDERFYGGDVRALGGDDLICGTGGTNNLDGGSGYDRCQAPADSENTFRSCEVIVEV